MFIEALMQSLQSIVRRHRTAVLGVEQRAHPRYHVPSDTCGEVSSPPSTHPQPARVLNLSLGGVGLLVDTPFHAGELLQVEFSRTDPDFSCTLVVSVVHCTEQPDGRYLVGGRFVDQLEPGELRLLIY
jgi:hypothetical protein